jgi:hypothetical protein
MSWFIDDARISLDPGMLTSHVCVDDQARAPIATAAGGRFAIPWKKRAVELLRISVGQSVETELWVDDVLVPPSDAGPLLGEAEACAAHGKRSKRRCPQCEQHVCKRCRAVDGVRCQACFDKAREAEHGLRKRSWLIGAAFMVVVAIALFAYGMQNVGSPAGKFAGAALFGAAYMAYTALRKRKTPESYPVTPLVFEVSAEPPQLVGTRCFSCDKRISSAPDGVWCATCRHGLHKACRKGHRCRMPALGPDWERLANADAA